MNAYFERCQDKSPSGQKSDQNKSRTFVRRLRKLKMSYLSWLRKLKKCQLSQLRKLKLHYLSWLKKLKKLYLSWLRNQKKTFKTGQDSEFHWLTKLSKLTLFHTQELTLWLNLESYPATSSFPLATLIYPLAISGYPQLTNMPLITSGWFPNVASNAQYSKGFSLR